MVDFTVEHDGRVVCGLFHARVDPFACLSETNK